MQPNIKYKRIHIFLILADFRNFFYHWIVISFKAVVELAKFHPEGRLEAFSRIGKIQF
jgi:hypothetical protein